MAPANERTLPISVLQALHRCFLLDKGKVAGAWKRHRFTNPGQPIATACLRCGATNKNR